MISDFCQSKIKKWGFVHRIYVSQSGWGINVAAAAAAVIAVPQPLDVLSTLLMSCFAMLFIINNLDPM